MCGACSGIDSSGAMSGMTASGSGGGGLHTLGAGHDARVLAQLPYRIPRRPADGLRDHPLGLRHGIRDCLPAAPLGLVAPLLYLGLPVLAGLTERIQRLRVVGALPFVPLMGDGVRAEIVRVARHRLLVRGLASVERLSGLAPRSRASRPCEPDGDGPLPFTAQRSRDGTNMTGSPVFANAQLPLASSLGQTGGEGMRRIVLPAAIAGGAALALIGALLAYERRRSRV
jgi:hypothetical protein